MSMKYKSVAQMVKAGDYEAMKGYFDANPDKVKEYAQPGDTARTIDVLLMTAAQHKSERQVDIFELLIANGADINAVDKNGTTLLMMAASNNDTALIKTLLEVPNINVRQMDENFTMATHHAISADAVEAFQVLYETQKFDINELKDILSGMTYLHWAAKDCNQKVCQMLIDYGIDATVEDAEGILASEYVPEKPEYEELFDKIEAHRNTQKSTKSAFDF